MTTRDTMDLIARSYQLRNDYQASVNSRVRVRAIMNGGAEAIKALLGEHVTDPDLPWANIMASGMTRLAQKIGQAASVRVPVPPGQDSQAARERAERKERAVEAYDELSRLELQLPQLGRWLPGYGFGVWVIGMHRSPDGDPYPKMSLRDSFDCYPAPWGPDQQPDDMAVWRTITVAEAIRRWPEKKTLIEKRYGLDGTGGGGFDGFGAGGRWENPQGRGIPLVEYWCADGTYVVLPDLDDNGMVDFVPNPIDSGPLFVVPKRFSFDQLQGQYDHTIGLMAAMAKINIMSILAMEDAVFTETNIIGDKPLGGQYKKGRRAVNVFPPGTQVQKPQSNLPYQLFEQINRIERQFRLVAGYPVTDDAQSPLNWATGAGLTELQSAVNAEVDEYHKVLRHALQDLDAKRLEFDEKVSPNRRKVLAGYRRGVGDFAVSYTPARDIRGNYRTKRTHGAMAAWDDSAKIVAGLQLLSAKVIDRLTLQENLQGLDNLTVINERIADEDARTALQEALMVAAQQGDPRAIMALIEMLPDDEQKRVFKKYFTPEEPQMSPEEAAMAGMGQPDPMAELFSGGAPDITTVLSRLSAGGSPVGGVQTVARV